MKSHISGIQIPTDSRINIDGGLTLDSLAGATGNVLISQGTGNTPSWTSAPSALTGLTIATGAGAGAGNASGAILIQTGNGSGSTGPSGSVTIDTGTGSGTAAGTILIGTTNTSALTIGRTGITTTINGTLALSSQTANTFLASPNSAAGTPSFRVLSYRDIYPAGLPTTFGQVIEYAPVGGGMAWTSSAPLLKGGGTMTGAFVGATATTSLAPIRLPSGTVPTTASQEFGMLAAGAESLQLSTTKTTGAGPGFGFIRAPQMVYAVANSTACTSSTPVSPFAAANDVLSSLEVGKAYRFRGVYYFTSTFTSGGVPIRLEFAFSNAPVIFKYNYKSYKAAGQAAFDFVGQSSTNAATTVTGTISATASYVVEFEGFFTSNATTASTLTPQFAQSAGGLSTVATAGSFFEIEKLGTSSQTLIAGNWA